MLSEYSSKGSRFPLTVPSNIVGSCGIMLNLERKSWRPILHMSTSSIKMLPCLGSTMRKSACINVDLPLPVRPTTPTFFLPGMIHVMFFKTDGRCSAYLTCINDKKKPQVTRETICKGNINLKETKEVE